MQIEIPEFALVAMIGASSSGKTTFAKKHFLPTEVLSSDFFRAMVSDDERDQKSTADAFDLLYYAAQKRLKSMKTTVVDATNLQPSARKRIIETAHEHDVHTVAIVLDLDEKILQERNKNRKSRNLSPYVIKKHHSELKRTIKELKREGFRFVYLLKSEEEINNVEIVRKKLWNNKKDEHGAFDIIGDIHGCFDELTMLLKKLGYIKNSDGIYTHPDGRKAIFIGDLCDRGSKNVDVLRLVMDMTDFGNAFVLLGNHDFKLNKYLNGKNVQTKNGLQNTIDELEKEDEDFRKRVKTFTDSLISHYVFDDGKLVVSHAGIKEEYIGRGSSRIKSFCIYGDVNGEKDENGFPIRRDWAADYRGTAINVYGHTPHKEVIAVNNTYCIDTGCVFGNKLTALRYPEKEIVSVDALKTYCQLPETLSFGNNSKDDTLRIDDIDGNLYLSTRLMPSVIVRKNNSAAALEIMSRFAADPHWLIYLPPTMSPCATSTKENYLEYPYEAFAYYRKNGVEKVICEKKHMGSRAVIVLCRNTETAKERFGVNDGSRGIIYTRTGRHFFEKGTYETEILDRLDAVLTKTNFWNDFNTDWVCLDTELMPWSEKAHMLLKKQYAPVGRAGNNSITAAIEALEKVCRRENAAYEVDKSVSGQNVDTNMLFERYREKKKSIELYTSAYREYCWNVKSTDDFRIAPFHLLAVENKVFSENSHIWHMETLKKYCTGIDDIFIATDYIEVNTSDDESIDNGINWWLSLTGKGGEGMVVKPEYFTARHNAELLQPAVKCRGSEYLRIIYGPEYLSPEHLKRLKKRSLKRKRSLALKEFSLGIESLERFVDKKPLYRVHECVFGVLAFESEPVDPRL